MSSLASIFPLGGASAITHGEVESAIEDTNFPRHFRAQSTFHLRVFSFPFIRVKRRGSTRLVSINRAGRVLMEKVVTWVPEMPGKP